MIKLCAIYQNSFKCMCSYFTPKTHINIVCLCAKVEKKVPKKIEFIKLSKEKFHSDLFACLSNYDKIYFLLLIILIIYR